MLRIAFVLLATFLVVSGCRQTITGPETPIDPVTNPTPDAADIAPLYVKGPAELPEGTQGNYRAEPLFHPELDYYEWRVLGIGRLSIETRDPNGLGRLITAEPTRPGSVLLTVRAYARDGRRLAYGEKAIQLSN